MTSFNLRKRFRGILPATLFLLYAALASAQEYKVLPGRISQGDTLPVVWLQEVTVRGKAHRSGWYRRQSRYRARLEYNVRKVYPYARLAARKVDEIESRLSLVDDAAERRKIIRLEYAGLMKTFKAPLMKLSITQGRILIRLIYRETSHTSFAHIKEYRGGLSACFWQSIARLFGNNLKAAYDPYGEDAEIEEIVRKIISGN